MAEELVHAHLVIEVAIEAEDVGMAEMRLDLNLPSQLVLHVGLLQLALEEDLQACGQEDAWSSATCHIMVICAPRDFEIRQFPSSVAPLLQSP